MWLKQDALTELLQISLNMFSFFFLSDYIDRFNKQSYRNKSISKQIIDANFQLFVSDFRRLIFNSQQLIDYIQNSMDEPEEKQPAPQNAEPQPVPQLNSLNSFKSVDSMNQDQSEKPPEDEGQQLQVVQTKVDKGINREEIMRMFNQQLEKEEKERQQIEKRRMEMRLKAKDAAKPPPKRPAIEQKKIAKGQALQQALSQKSARIRKMIQPHCKKYRAMFRPSIYDTKLNKYRFQCKEKLFLNLCYGIEELRGFAPQQLSPLERDILTQDTYTVVKRLATQIDAALVKILNKGDRNDIGREYKSQWQTLLANVKDEGNLQLKRKILSRTMQPSKIALANEIDFFTLAKRQEIIEKQKRYVAQFTVQKAIAKPIEEHNEELLDKPRVEEQLPQAEPTLKPQRTSLANKYIDQSSILSIQQFLSEGQLSKMLKRLEEDIQGKSQGLLIRNFKETFKL